MGRSICQTTTLFRLACLVKLNSQVIKPNLADSFIEQIATLYEMVTGGNKAMTYLVIGNIALQLFL